MNHAQLQAALSYNRNTSFDESEIKLIQETTGSTPDGLWGPRTAQAVALWQAENGLKADGKVGPITWEAITNYEEKLEPSDGTPCPMRVGVWGDDAPSRMAKDSYANKLQQLKITRVALMMNYANVSRSAEPWDLRWNDKGEEGWHDDIIARIADKYEKRGIRLILTTWPQPSKDQMDAMFVDMVSLMKITRAVAFEVDVEGNWHTRHMDGSFKSMDAAGAYLVRGMVAVNDEVGLGAITESTTFGHHAELGRFPTVTQRTDKACVQGYSVSPRQNGPVGWNDKLGPGGHQRWIYQRAKAAGAPKVCMGLAAWKQSGFKNRSPQEAMQRAWDVTRKLEDVDEVRFWSSKWILGSQSKKTPYAAKFIRSMHDQIFV
jgi:hypothetical protein